MRAQIKAISSYLPQTTLTNQVLAKQNPNWDMDSVVAKAGVVSRHIAGADETSFDMAARACDQLIKEIGIDKNSIDGIIFCTQSPDYIMPPNSHLIHKHLGLTDRVIAFDLNLACSGFVYALALCHSLIHSKMASNVLLITSETYSKFIHPSDRSSRVLFGDGAAVTLVTGAETKGFIDSELSSHGDGFEKFYIPAGGMRCPKSQATSTETTDRNGNVRSLENIHMDGLGVWSFINSVVPKQIKRVLEKNKLSIPDIDQFIFHQASQMTIDSLIKSLDLQERQVFINLSQLGNTVSASIPLAFKQAQEQGVIKENQKIILCGFGVGFSYATVLLET
ncbi:MAG: 3-oxoacyl-ACP synthase III family protein [Bdellovibrionales bacterium]